MKIEFRLFDKETSAFKQVYFLKWDNNIPLFTSNPKFAKQYWTEKLAESDYSLLQKARSATAITLSIKIVS